LEEPKSPFLELLYKNKCIRTQKKQKVFFWYSVPYDRLFQDVLKRDRKRELNGKKSNIVIDKSKSPIIKKEISKPVDSRPSDINIFKGEIEISNNLQNTNIIYTKWIDETQKLSNPNNNSNDFESSKVKKENDIKIKKEETTINPQLRKIKKGKKYIITKYFAKGPIANYNHSSLKFVCDKKDCNKKFKKLEELVNHKKFVHSNDRIGYNYSKDFMYVEKSLSFEKNGKNQLESPSSTSTSSNTSYIISTQVELEDENNNWSIIISPENSISSGDESMIIGNDQTNFSLNDYSLSNISNSNENYNMNLDLKNVPSMSLFKTDIQGSNDKTGKNNAKDHRLSVSSSVTLNNKNNNNIFSTSTTTAPDLADTSMNTTFLSNQTFSNNSSFIIQSSDNKDIPCEVTTVSSSTVQPMNQCTPINNNNIPNVNDMNIPTTHFMTIDSPIHQDGTVTNYMQNVPVQNQNIPAQNQNIPVQNQNIPVQNQNIPVQNQNIPVQNQNIPVQNQNQATQYITTEQFNNTAATVQYVPSILEVSTTSSGNYISYELSPIVNQVTSSPVNVYVTTKANPDSMNYISSPTALEYQRMNQPQPQPHTPTSNYSVSQQQTMFYSLPTETNPSTIGQTYIQPQTQYVQVQTHPQQQIYIPHENVQTMVQVSYQ
jgi:hypothetical protein